MSVFPPTRVAVSGPGPGREARQVAETPQGYTAS